MTIFGRIVSRQDLENAAMETCKTWIDTYLAEVERQRGIDTGFYQRPKSYTTVNSVTKWDEDQLPAIIVVSNGFSQAPRKKGDGTFDTWWGLGIACIVSGNDEASTREFASDYTAALRALFNQRVSLDGFADGTDFVDEHYDDIQEEDRRSMASGQVIFSVEVDNVVQTKAGPITPDDPPSDPEAPIPDWPIATSVHLDGVTIVKEIS